MCDRLGKAEMRWIKEKQMDNFMFYSNMIFNVIFKLIKYVFWLLEISEK